MIHYLRTAALVAVATVLCIVLATSIVCIRRLHMQPIIAERLYIPEGSLDFIGAAGNFSVAGNRFIARELYRKLSAHPALAGIPK